MSNAEKKRLSVLVIKCKKGKDWSFSNMSWQKQNWHTKIISEGRTS